MVLRKWTLQREMKEARPGWRARSKSACQWRVGRASREEREEMGKEGRLERRAGGREVKGGVMVVGVMIGEDNVGGVREDGEEEEEEEEDVREGKYASVGEEEGNPR